MKEATGWRQLATAMVVCATASGLAVGAWRVFTGHKAALNEETLLAGAGAGPAELPSRRARRALLVILDGLRVDVARELRFLGELRRQGIDATAAAMPPTISLPGYVSIMTGVPPAQSGVRSNAYLLTCPLESLVACARTGGLTTSFLGPSPSGLGWLFGPGPEQETAPGPPPDLTVALTWEIDIASHGFGGRSRECQDAATLADQQLRRWARGFDLARDAIVVTADHGHVDRGGHGGLEPVVVEVPLVLAGAGFRADARPAGARSIDIAPTLAAILGLHAPAQSMGRTLTEVLDVTEAERESLRRADAARHHAIDRRLAERRPASVRAARGRRLARATVVVGALLAALVLLAPAFRLRRPTPHRGAWVGVGQWAVANVVALSLYGFHLSPSYGPSRARLGELALTYGALLAVVAVVACLSSGVRLPADRLAAWLGSSALGLLLSGAVMGVALVGALPPYAGRLPPPWLFAALPMSALAAASLVAIVAGTAGVHALLLALSWARGRRRPLARSCSRATLPP